MATTGVMEICLGYYGSIDEIMLLDCNDPGKWVNQAIWRNFQVETLAFGKPQCGKIAYFGCYT